MSELKTYFLSKNNGIEFQVYLKSEADKVIVDLEMKLAAVQQVLRLNKPEALYSNLETMSRLNRKIYDVERRERHQKYKRCLAMAKWCESEAYIHEPGLDYDEDLVAWFGKWYTRWLELAEKFKEGLVIGVDKATGTDKSVVINYKESK